MKKVPILILFIFCLCTFFGNFFFAQNYVSAESVVTISTAQQLVEYVNQYDASNVNDKITLGGNINLSGHTLSKTIGTLMNPFQGTFNGNGYTILNLSLSSNEADLNKTNQFVGLFGVAENATFQSIALGGDISISTRSGLSSYVGALVGKADNCTFKHNQISGKISFKHDFDSNIVFGSLVGMAQDCDVSYVICRAQFGGWNFLRNDNRIHTFGALVGRLLNSSIVFSVIESNFAATLENSFEGKIFLGGVVGTVSEGGSKIVNVAIENSYDVATSNNIKLGEVAGLISNPVHRVGNISYIHYKKNEGVSQFGSAGDYDFQNENITESVYSLTSLGQSDDGKKYFTDTAYHPWHPFYGSWDFDTIWFVVSSHIQLQSFSDRFSIRVASANTDEEKSILLLKNTLNSNGYKYGEEVRLQFQFKSEIKDFYYASAINLGSVEVAKITTKEVDGKKEYALTGSELFDIQPLGDGNDGFEIIIKSVSLATAGNYSVSTIAKTFTGKVSSKLYDMEEEIEDIPAYVFADGAPISESLSLNKITYGQHYHIETKAKPGKPYAFEMAWVMLKEDGTTIEIKEKALDFTFGYGDFDCDFVIFAKYSVNACNITCKMDSGIVKIVFYEKDAVESSDQSIAVSKTEQTLKIEIYVDKQYNFDKQQFIDEMDTYKSTGPNVTFCSFVQQTEKPEGNCFEFVLNLTTLQGDYANAFTINAKTTKQASQNNSWLWWVVGGIAGGVILAGLIVLIVVLAKRRGGGFGGMSGSGKVSKKSYKNMYY